jgi:cell division protein FtsI (penicillin-binding protein 3)
MPDNKGKSKLKKAVNISLEGQLNKIVEKSRIRILFVVSLIMITFIVIAGKTIKLTFFNSSGNKTTRIYNSNEREEGLRVNIVDRNEVLIASSLVASSVVANPQKMIEKESAAKQLSPYITKYTESQLLKIFNSDKSFQWLKRKIHPQEKYEINSLGLPGIYFEEEEKRVYPHGNLFSHTIGMVGVDSRGLTAFEKYFDDISDNDKIKLISSDENIKTSLDVRVQDVVREELIKQKLKHKANRAAAIVLDVNTGEVISLVSLPDYDPNKPSEISNAAMFNVATLGNYEMGSTFKPLTFAMGFEENKIKLWSKFDASKPIEISRFTISDFHPKERVLSVPEVLMYSSNIGTAKIAERLGPDKIQEYFRKLGFYEKLDIEIAEKSSPIMPRKWREVTTLTASYGHGIAVSPIHMISAFASTINGGYYIEPTIMKVKDPKQINKRKIFGEKTSDIMRKLLRLVVSEGSGSRGDAEGYFVGGKTGTAEKLAKDGNYSDDELVSSFIGVFPMNDPKYAVLVMLDEPKATKDTWGFATGGWVSAPAVSRIISKIAPILKVKPVDKDSYKIRQEFKVKYKL